MASVKEFLAQINETIEKADSLLKQSTERATSGQNAEDVELFDSVWWDRIIKYSHEIAQGMDPFEIPTFAEIASFLALDPDFYKAGSEEESEIKELIKLSAVEAAANPKVWQQLKEFGEAVGKAVSGGWKGLSRGGKAGVIGAGLGLASLAAGAASAGGYLWGRHQTIQQARGAIRAAQRQIYLIGYTHGYRAAQAKTRK